MGLFSFLTKRKTFRKRNTQKDKRKRRKTSGKRGGMEKPELSQAARPIPSREADSHKAPYTHEDYDVALEIYMNYIGRKKIVTSKNKNVSINDSTARDIAYFLDPRGFKDPGSVIVNNLRNYFQNLDENDGGNSKFIASKEQIKAQLKRNEGEPTDFDSVVGKFESDLKDSKETKISKHEILIAHNQRVDKLESKLTRSYEESKLTRDKIFKSHNNMVISNGCMFKVDINTRDTELFLYGSIDDGTTWYRANFDGPNKIYRWYLVRR
jgi:hypothetical protein